MSRMGRGNATPNEESPGEGILGKPGVSGRGEAAAILYRLGLVDATRDVIRQPARVWAQIDCRGATSAIDRPDMEETQSR
jgi:hypothetical protein